MADQLRVAIAGLGTVGVGTIRLLLANRDLIARRAGKPIEVVAVSARDRDRNRGVDLDGLAWCANPDDLVRQNVDVIVELMGGSEGAAISLARAAIAAGKGFVTANKAMIAHHGLALAQEAEAAGIPFKYEAAVAGGVPVIKGLREGAAANEIARVYGILNGTCNYILTTMEADGRSFADVLADAQNMGYAEADPSFDIDGVDAAHKLSILSSLAFGSRIDFEGVETAGIRPILPGDIAEARALGYRIRLIGLAEMIDGALIQRVSPALVPASHPLAHVAGAMNAVVAEGNYVGRLFFEGRGAGEGPTASAVVSDLIDIARGESGPAFAMPVAHLDAVPRGDWGKRTGRAYLRFTVADRTGVLAELTAAMRDAGVSIESMIQRGEAPDGGVMVVMTTHEAPGSAVASALAALEGSKSLTGTPITMPILDF